MPRCFSYQSWSCGGLSDLKKIPPIPVTRFMSLLYLISRARSVAGDLNVVVTLLGDFAWEREKSPFRVGRLRAGKRSRDQPGVLADLHGLRPPLGAELIKQPARMGLHRVFADEQPPGNLSIAQPAGYEPENLQLARGDAELAHAHLVGGERTRGRRRDFLEDHRRLLSGECLPEPDAQSRKQHRDQRAVDFDGMLDYQEPVLRPLQHGNQEPTD